MTVLNVTPMLAVADIDAAIRFLTDCLGFKLEFRADGYAYVSRDGGAIRLIDAPQDAHRADPVRQIIVYVDVDDVDAEFAERRKALEALPDGAMRPPFDQPYLQREFHAAHGPFLFIVGQDIRP